MQEFITIPSYLIRELPKDKLYALLDILAMSDENMEVHTSERALMKRWGWGNTKVRNFIEYLERKSICKSKAKHEQSSKQSTVLLINTGFVNSYQSSIQSRNKSETKHKQSAELTKLQSQNTEVYKRIIDCLNNRCGTRYRYENEDAVKFIQERLDEGFSEEDFYTVIDKKANEWIGTKWEQYLRPYTLFRKDKFEGYLNQRTVNRRMAEDINASRQSQLEYLLNSIREDEMNGQNGI